MATKIQRSDSPFDRRRHPDGMAFGDWRAPDGWVHRAWSWPAPAGVRPRGSLMFQSGRADFIEKYLEACDHWHGRGWALEGFDWRGQGGSRPKLTGRVPDDRLSFDPLVDDLAAFVAEWRGRTPGPHVVVAHSMGGHVALRACAERDMGLDALVLVAPMLALNTRRIPALAVRALTRGARFAGWGARAIGPDDVHDPRRQFRLTASRERYADSQWWKEAIPGIALGPPSWNWIAAALAAERHIFAPDVLEGVRTPVLMLAAGLDVLVRNDAIARAVGRLPDADCQSFAGARHELLREEDAHRLAALGAIDRFLDRRAPAA